MMTSPPLTFRVALPTPLRHCFDYLPPATGNWENLPIGVRVRVPFQQRELVGVFMGFNHTAVLPEGKLKSIKEILDEVPVFSPDIFQLCGWAADYYHESVGEVFANAMPALLRQGKPPILSKKALPTLCAEEEIPLLLNAEQAAAVAAIQFNLTIFQVFLLDGVTGSGKTEVYLHVIKQILGQNKQILVLVPEIGLTPQTIQRFRERFAVPVVALHSGLTQKQRLNAWILAKNNSAKIIIGTRLAIFTPFAQLGLIIIDEEHDLSFKQQDRFRYHARDVAIMRAFFNKIPIILGSATPSLEALYKAQQGKFQHLYLHQRAGKAKLPGFKIIDIRKVPMEQGLSTALLTEMKTHLLRDEQVMLFLNRRGFAPVLMCHSCGWMVNCQRCDIRMTYHKHSHLLNCHHCGIQKKIVETCGGCTEKSLQLVGMGTERLEAVLKKYFPNYSIARIDRDTTQRKGDIEKLLQSIHDGEHQILIGTQMLAKGHHFSNVTLVAIVDADGGLFSSDFRGLERMGQLLLQVAGRAGRMEKPGEVILQTHHPDHPLLQQLFTESYQNFATTLLGEREAAALPPYTFFALFRAEAYQQAQAMDFLQQVKNLINPASINLQVLGPISAPMPRRAGRYRAQLLLQAKYRPQLQNFLKSLLHDVEKMPRKNRVRWSLDVDPVEMF